ncbi:hypothetical protein Tco_1021586 [Tanacetum coccineum]
MPTEMELTLEQTQQGVSYEVSNIRVNSFTMKMEILLEPTSNKLMVEHAEFDESNANVLERFYTSAGNPVKEILLKLNLPDHRILKDGGEVLKITSPLTSKDKGTSSSLKSNITTSYSQDKKKKEVCEHKNEDLHSMIVHLLCEMSFLQKLNGKNFWEVSADTNDSWGWKNLLEIRDEISKHVWIISNRSIYSARLTKDMVVADMVNGTGQGNVESHDHLFFNCPFSQAIWKELKILMQFQSNANVWGDIIDELAEKPNNSSIWSIIRRLCLVGAVYAI